MQILDPTDEREPVRRQLSARPESLGGRIALLDISKPRGNILIDRIESILRERVPEAVLTRYNKPTFTKPAPLDLRRKIAEESDFVIEALAD